MTVCGVGIRPRTRLGQASSIRSLRCELTDHGAVSNSSSTASSRTASGSPAGKRQGVSQMAWQSRKSMVPIEVESLAAETRLPRSSAARCKSQEIKKPRIMFGVLAMYG